MDAPTFVHIVPLDVNHDGLGDLVMHYWANAVGTNPPSNVPCKNRLVIVVQQPNHTFLDQTSTVLTGPADLGACSAERRVADVNEDGWPDIVYATSQEDGRNTSDAWKDERADHRAGLATRQQVRDRDVRHPELAPHGRHRIRRTGQGSRRERQLHGAERGPSATGERNLVERVERFPHLGCERLLAVQPHERDRTVRLPHPPGNLPRRLQCRRRMARCRQRLAHGAESRSIADDRLVDPDHLAGQSSPLSPWRAWTAPP
jgi:hypothetical protein